MGTFDFKERRTDITDTSPFDICRLFNSQQGKTKVGVYQTNIDLVIYKHVDGRRKTQALIDFKHNSITSNIFTTINLSQDSLLEIRDMADDLSAGSFVSITYTKENEQEHQMFFNMPTNKKGWGQLTRFYGRPITYKDFWMTPYQMSMFCFYLSDKTPMSDGNYKTLSNHFTTYELPDIVCNSKKNSCECMWCSITRSNNELLAKENNDASKAEAITV